MHNSTLWNSANRGAYHRLVCATANRSVKQSTGTWCHVVALCLVCRQDFSCNGNVRTCPCISKCSVALVFKDGRSRRSVPVGSLYRFAEELLLWYLSRVISLYVDHGPFAVLSYVGSYHRVDFTVLCELNLCVQKYWPPKRHLATSLLSHLSTEKRKAFLLLCCSRLAVSLPPLTIKRHSLCPSFQGKYKYSPQ